jgi:GT2 family glycosyltransferase
VAVALLAAVVLAEGPMRWIALAVFLSGGVGVGLALLLVRTGRAIQARQARLERLVTENHKRASVWNYHLTSGLGLTKPPAAEHTAPVAELAHAGVPHEVREVRQHPDARRLVDAGIFDAEHYSALVKGEFATPTEAASHYVRVNAANGVSPSPFIEVWRLPEHVRTALGLADVKPLLAFLRSPDVYDADLSELFCPRESGVELSAARRHPGGVLGAFLERVEPGTPVPVPVERPPAGSLVRDVRMALVAHAEAVHRTRTLVGSRTVDSWDPDAERRWLVDLRSVRRAGSPLVTVVMPVRDRADVIGRAVRSVQDQTHTRWELLVVDDASVDSTRERVSGLAAQDERIRLLPGAGLGVSHARNLGLEAAAGEYIAFLDSDNEWTVEFLQTMVSAMQRDGLAAAYSGMEMRSSSGRVTYRAFEGGIEHLRLFNHVDLNVLVVRRDALAGIRFDDSLRRWVDHDFVLKLAAVAEPVLLPFIGCEYEDSEDRADRITVQESEHWQWVVLGKHWVDWNQAESTVPGRLSVVVPTHQDSEMTIAAVRSVLTDARVRDLDVEVVLVDNGSPLEVGQRIIAALGASSRVKYRWLPRNLNFAIGCNVGATMATGELVLFLNNDTEVRSGALRALIERMRDPGVIGAQPLLLYGDETIQTAGTVFTVRDGLPNHLFVGHPPADALSLADCAFDAVSAAALMMRTQDVRELGGFDPLYVNGMEDVDLCLRGRATFDGTFAVVPKAVVTHLEGRSPGRGAHVEENRRLFLERWRGRLPEPQAQFYEHSGFVVSHVASDGTKVPGPRPIIARSRLHGQVRVGIHIGSFAGAAGDTWGDTHFGESLRAAFERQGLQAVVHRESEARVSAAAYDDVVLVVRGTARVRPMPGKANILWIISHPEDVTLDELREFDAVFAASEPWARKMSAASGREIRPLLQATDSGRFHDGVRAIGHDRPIFVGGTHPGRSRGVVEAARAAGLELHVYGNGWTDQLPPDVLLGDYIANSDLCAHYRGAPRVLADHWADMAAEGFVQNRVFDAVASGARVVSDAVEGIEELFSGAVRTYGSSDELAYLCGARSEFPDDGEMRKIAAHVRAHHSFDARAGELTQQIRMLLHRGSEERP